MIEFGGEYTRAQWRRGIHLAMYPTGRALYLRLLALAICLAGVIILGVGRLQGEALQPARALRTLFTLAALAVWAALPFFRAWRAAEQPWRRSAPRPSLRGVVTPEGIRSNADAGVEEKWGAFLRARIREDIIVLISSSGLATILPREFFATEDDWRNVRQYVEFNVVSPS